MPGSALDDRLRQGYQTSVGSEIRWHAPCHIQHRSLSPSIVTWTPTASAVHRFTWTTHRTFVSPNWSQA